VGEEIIELLRGDVVAFQLGPCIGVGIVRVHAPNEVMGEPMAGLIAVECLKRAREYDPTKVPENGPNCVLCHLLEATGYQYLGKGWIAPDWGCESA
jgi:hypothetical protein